MCCSGRRTSTFRAIGITICLLATAVVVIGDDKEKDPIREKLFAAKVAYDREMRLFRTQTKEWFDKREEAARRAGDKKELDQVKEERQHYEDNGELPRSAPTALVLKRTRAKKSLESAYIEAIKAYTKAGKDELASAIEKEWESFTQGTPLPDSAIDLLALVNPKTHSLAGDWKKNKNELVGAGTDKIARLQFPYEPGEEYDIEVKCKRVEGGDSLCLGLVVEGRQVLAAFDAWSERNFRTGLDLVDGKGVEDNLTTIKGQLLKSNQSYTLLCSVRKGQVNMSINGKEIVSLKGEGSRFSLQNGFAPPNEKALFVMVGLKTAFQIDALVVKPVTGKGNILK